MNFSHNIFMKNGNFRLDMAEESADFLKIDVKTAQKRVGENVTVRVLLGEEIVDVVPERLDLRLAAIEYLQVVHIHNNLDLRHLSDVKLSPFVCVGQQCHAVRMVHEALHAFRSEIRQYRHDDGLVGVHGQIGHAPAGAVAGPKGDVLPLLKTGLVEEDVELLDRSGHL